MKAKTILFMMIASLFLMGGTGCEKEKTNDLTGSWQLIETNISGGGAAINTKVKDGYIINFQTSDILKIAQYPCNGKYELKESSSIISIYFDCRPNAEINLPSISKLSIKNDVLTLDGVNCDELCQYIYKRL